MIFFIKHGDLDGAAVRAELKSFKEQLRIQTKEKKGKNPTPERDKVTKEMKKHIDCDCLIRIRDGIYCCCDSRSPKLGKIMDKKEAI